MKVSVEVTDSMQRLDPGVPDPRHNCFHRAFQQDRRFETSDTPAIIEPLGVEGTRVEHRVVSYREFLEGVNRVASRLVALGVERGDRVLILVPMSTELYQSILAVMKIGAVCLFIDPADGIENLDRSAASMSPKAFIGVPRAHALRMVSSAIRRIPIQISIWPTLLLRAHDWGELFESGSPDWKTAPVLPGEPAMISFTSGSTGQPKGVCRTHDDMRAIFEMLCKHEAKRLLGVDFCAFPVLPLDDLSFGRSCLLPRAQPGKLGEARPADLADQMRQFPPTLVSAPPSTLRALVDHFRSTGERFPAVAHVFTGGGVVPIPLVRDLSRVWPEAELHMLYGSTEAEPVSMIDAREILEDTARRTEDGDGVCVGRPAPDVQVAIVTAVDGPLSRVTPIQDIGEIVVAGPHVNRTYYGDEETTRRYKIHDERTGTWWHRMGDLGFLDNQGRLWLAGRLSDHVDTPEKTLYPAMVEPIFDALEGVRKTALIGVDVVLSGVPQTVAALLVELDRECGNRRSEGAAAPPREPQPVSGQVSGLPGAGETVAEGPGQPPLPSAPSSGEAACRGVAPSSSRGRPAPSTGSAERTEAPGEEAPEPAEVLERIRGVIAERKLPIRVVRPCERVLYDSRIGAKIQYATLARRHGPAVRAELGDSVLSRMAIYRRERFPVPRHAFAALVFTAGIAGFGSELWLEHLPQAAAALLAVFGFFWHLRVFDELKDVELDRLVHPERPLPRGIVSPEELTRNVAVVVAAEALTAMVLGSPAFAWWSFAMAYSLLMRAEFFSPRFMRAHLLLFGFSHSFVAFFLAQFVVAAAGGTPIHLSAGLLAAALAWIAEVSRKLDTEPPHPALERRIRSGEADESYARQLGAGSAVLLLAALHLAALLAVLAGGGAVAPWQYIWLGIAFGTGALASASFWFEPSISRSRLVKGGCAVASLLIYALLALRPLLA